MLFLASIGALLFIALIFGPQAWVKNTMRAHGTERPDLPHTGAELARLLLDKAGLNDFKIQQTNFMGDHYSPDEKAIRLSQENYSGRSITALAVAAHEVSHAIQDRDGYWPFETKQRLVRTIQPIERFASKVLWTAPFIYSVLRAPFVLVLQVAAAVGLGATTLVIHLFTLPTELDASFNRALPILTHFLKPEDMRSARKVLRAAAFTYVAGALVNLINIARWLRILRF